MNLMRISLKRKLYGITFMILIIDHKDSFTRNLEHQLSDFDQVYVEDRKDIQNSILEDASIIVFSPGPENLMTIQRAKKSSTNL